MEDGVLQGRIEGERLKLLEARGNVGEVSSGPDSQSATISRRLQFSERNREKCVGDVALVEQLELFSELSKQVQNDGKISIKFVHVEEIFWSS